MTKILPALCALVLDGQECHALSAVRSLGRHGVRVAVASHKPDAMGFYSRYCAVRLHTPSPVDAPEAFGDWLQETLRRTGFDALLFFGEASAQIVARRRDAIQGLAGCPLPPLETFLTADRKDRVARLAQDLGVPVPRTHELTDLQDAARLAERLDMPAIVKGVYGSCGRQVLFVRDRTRLVDAVRRVAALGNESAAPLPVVQEYVPGRGYGLSAVLRQGEPLAVFMHRRLEEHDVARGLRLAHPAAGAQSVDEPELRDAGLRLLGALRWDGVAMVEFRRSDRDGRFYLMEINPRFVGSLDLAVAAGVDLPWIYTLLAAGRPVEASAGYRVGVQYHWLLSKNVAQAFENPLAYARSALATLRPAVRCDLCLSDPGPHRSHLKMAAWWMREHLLGRNGHTAAAPAPATPAAPDPAPEPATERVQVG